MFTKSAFSSWELNEQIQSGLKDIGWEFARWSGDINTSENPKVTIDIAYFDVV